MRSNMTISVGVCTHNGAKYIEEQLNSIISQTVKPDEIILSDDNSSDETLAIAERVLSVCGIRYSIKAHREHQGITKNFSSCFDLCTGDIIFSSDQDDIWMKDKIESFLPFFKRGNVFVYSNAEVIDENKNILLHDFWSIYGTKFTQLTKKQFSKKLLTSMCIAGCNMAFTKELYHAIRPTPFHFIHDSWIAICAPWFGEISFIDKPLIMYRQHANNSSGFTLSSSEKANQGKPKVEKKTGSAYKTEEPNHWFNNPCHYYMCSVVFNERMRSVVDNDYAKLIDKSIRYHNTIMKCLPKQKISSFIRLVYLYVIGDYRLFRGSFKQLMRDIYYIISNNKAFSYDTSMW